MRRPWFARSTAASWSWQGSSPCRSSWSSCSRSPRGTRPRSPPPPTDSAHLTSGQALVSSRCQTPRGTYPSEARAIRSPRPAGEQAMASPPDLQLERVRMLLLPGERSRRRDRGPASARKRDVHLELGVREDLDLGRPATGVLETQPAGGARAGNRGDAVSY